MTGAPEAALARELGICYAPLALVTDLDAGAETGEGVDQESVFALFRANLARLTGLLERAIGKLLDPEGCTCSTWADDLELTTTWSHLRCPGRCRARGRQARPDAPASSRCHGATTWHSPTRRPDPDTAAALAAMHAAGVARLVLASSMVVYGEGRYACPRHGVQQPPARSVAALESGDFETHCPTCDGALDWQTVDEDARCDPRSSYAVSKLAQELYAATWARQGGGSATALRHHNVYGPGMPRYTPYPGVAAIFRSSLVVGGRGARALCGVQRLLGSSAQHPRRRSTRRRGHGSAAGAGRDGTVPTGRCAPRRRLRHRTSPRMIDAVNRQS